MNDALVIEVWGRQKDESSANGDLNTKELMAREKTMITGGKNNTVGQVPELRS